MPGAKSRAFFYGETPGGMRMLPPCVLLSSRLRYTEHGTERGSENWSVTLVKGKHGLEIEDYKILLEMRCAGYNVLKQIFYVEPTKPLLLSLRDNDVFAGFPFLEDGNLIGIGAKMIRDFFAEYEGKDDEMTEKVRWDFTQLFVGPYALPSPPWESVYRSNERLLYQDAAFDVRKDYLKYQFIPKNYPHEADDHIGFELDFMYRLSGAALDQAGSGQEDKTLSDGRKFLQEHLSQWVPDFSRDIQKNALTAFYQGAAVVLKGFIAEDLNVLQDILDE